MKASCEFRPLALLFVPVPVFCRLADGSSFSNKSSTSLLRQPHEVLILRPAMKLVIAFFLSLFCVSGGALTHAYAANGKMAHTRALNIKKLQISSVNVKRDYLISMDDLSHENTYVINDEDESEENIFRRHVSLAGCFIEFSYEILSSQLYSSSSESRTFDKPDVCADSCRYIFQRVLRI
jgi:hypothetical protein